MLLDEALVDFADAQPTDASLALLEEHPHLLVFRSFSKAWGLAGLRIGYAVGGPGSEELLAELEPDLGVSELSQAGALEALRSGAKPLARHVQSVCEERPRLTAELRERGFEVTDSQANFLWVAHPKLDGTELATRMERAGVLVAAGAGLGRAASRAHRAAQRRRHRPRAERGRQGARLSSGARGLRRLALAQQRAGGALEDPAPGARVLLVLLGAVSASKCSTTVRSRSGEISIPCRLVTSR